jgi:hypothetical protein
MFNFYLKQTQKPNSHSYIVRVASPIGAIKAADPNKSRIMESMRKQGLSEENV